MKIFLFYNFLINKRGMEHQIFLTNVKNKKSLFCFVKIDNLMSKYENKINIHIDAYFRLQHIESKHFIGVDEEHLAECYLNAGYNDAGIQCWVNKKGPLYLKSHKFMEGSLRGNNVNKIPPEIFKI